MHKRVVCTCAMSLPCIILWRTIRLRVQFVRDHLLPPLSLFHSLQTQYAERESWGSSWWAQFYTSWRCQIPRIRRGCRYTIDGRLALMMKTRVNCRWPRGFYMEDGACAGSAPRKSVGNCDAGMQGLPISVRWVGAGGK